MIRPQSTEALLRLGLKDTDTTAEKHEHCYHFVPIDPGKTNMSLRSTAIKSLLEADAQ